MKKNTIITLKSASVLVCTAVFIALNSCTSFVQDISPPIDQITEEALNTEAQADFLIRGVQSRFSISFEEMSMFGGGLSDELIFDARSGTGGLVIYEEIDRALNIDRANGTLAGVLNGLGRFRFHADDIVRRTSQIQFRRDSTRRRMVFTGAFYGAVARYFYANYIGINKEQGGGIINNGQFIPATAMHDSALALLSLAEQNTMRARIHLIEGRFAQAQTIAQNGMRQGDAPLLALYSVIASNTWWNNAGIGRAVFLTNRRFDSVYIRQDRTDTARIKLRGPITRSGFTYYFQLMYPLQDSPIRFLSWQENELIAAETEIRANNNQNTPSALTRLNRIRGSYAGLQPIASTATVNLDFIQTERDKELFCTGARLIDQRRFSRWHLGANTWRFLPITQQEINNNPNIPPLIKD
jgi:starch-binding outer membrane protein, SusD/RagB family